MDDAERQELLRRCHEAELRAKTLAECLDVIAGKFSALTSALVGMRLGRLEDAKSDHGARIGDLEVSQKKTDETLSKSRDAYKTLSRVVKEHAFKTQAAPEQPVQHVRAAGPNQATETSKA